MRAPRRKVSSFAPPEPASLVAVPAEIQCSIASYLVQYRDLNNFSQSCKTLKAITLLQLYRTIELKVPLKWNRLASLERLLATSPESLQYTRGLHIVTQQAPIKDDRYGSRDNMGLRDWEEGDDDEESRLDTEESRLDDEDDAFRLYHPGRWASNALNALIRLLILKLSRQQLSDFRWYHECPLATLTLAVLFNNHGGALQTLEFRQYTQTWKKTDITVLAMAKLFTLRIAALDVLGSKWPIYLLATNLRNLRDLQLSNETEMALNYRIRGTLDSRDSLRRHATDRLLDLLKTKHDALPEPTVPMSRLDTLSLCGFDLSVMVRGSPSPLVDFNKLSSLIIQSCIGLNEALSMLMGTNVAQRGTMGVLQLRKLIMRHENADDAFMLMLKAFLMSLCPLTTLHVLLEGDSEYDILGESLKPHGKSLESLIWDERSGPRTHVQLDTTSTNVGNLRHIAKHCIKLRALGIPLHWQELTEPNSDHSKVASYFSRLRHLQTLNIRNLPAAPTAKTWLPNDYMLDGLAIMLLKIISLKLRTDATPVLKTLALGALTYGDVMMGVNHYPTHQFANFLQLRIYRVNFDYASHGARTPRLHMIAKGTPAEAIGNAENLDIFDVYWLDGAPKRAKRIRAPN